MPIPPLLDRGIGILKEQLEMTKEITTTLGAASLGIAFLLTLVTIPCAFGAGVTANVPFPFQVESKTLPAGDYQFDIDLASRIVNIHGPKGSSVIVAFITTLATAPHTNATDTHIVFDKVGDTYALSELWEAGVDGVLVYATKGPHEHHVLHVKK
jgi:hypothetical protein